jgi:hypothetical protein
MFLSRQIHLPLQVCLLSWFLFQHVCCTWIYHCFCFIYIKISRALAVLFPGTFMNFSFEFGSALGSTEVLFFSATTSRMARTATYHSIHYLYPGLPSRGESDRSMKLTGNLLTMQRIRTVEAADLLSYCFHCLVLSPLYHCVVTIFTTCINIKQLYIMPRQCVFCIILSTDYTYVSLHSMKGLIFVMEMHCVFFR